MNLSDFTDVYTTFEGFRKIHSGSLLSSAVAVKRALAAHSERVVLTFEDQTGRTIDLDTRPSIKELTAKVAAEEKAKPRAQAMLSDNDGDAEPMATAETRGRGRPKLGVIAREVTLLPRHWEWLANQPGGASIALRKLVEEARKTHAEKDRVRAAHDRAYHFMLAIAGDLPGYEEATRALFANDRTKFTKLIKAWPADVKGHATHLAFGELEQ